LKLVIFDIDGTLSRTNIIDQACFLSTAQALISSDIKVFEPERFTHFTDQNMVIELFEWYNGSPPKPQAYEGFQHMYLNCLKKAQQKSAEDFQAIAGATHILEHLAGDWAIALATGCWLASAKLKLGFAGIDTKEHPIATSDDQRSRHAIVQTAIQKAEAHYQQSFDQLVYIGDGIWDLRTCADLGIPFVGIEAEQKAHKRQALGTHFLLENYLDIEQVRTCLEQAVVPIL
jgi:phosphoglycolate phosphatase-like HAD superfamily hydrolase